jgi:cobalt/nickel transport system permease protein
MHLGDGAITTECAVLGLATSLVGLGVCYQLPRPQQKTATWQVAAWGTLVFAAQMINIPIGEYSSAHWVGGVSLAFLLGPWLATQVMGVILLLQALLLGDGSWQAWGVNWFNMGIMPAFLYAVAERWSGRNLWTVGCTAALATMLAAMLIPLEVAIGRNAAELSHWQRFFSAMLSFHLLAAGLEAACTMAAIQLVQQLERAKVPSLQLNGGIIALAFLLAGGSIFISSQLPDGYEAAAEVAMQSLLQSESIPWLASILSNHEWMLCLLSTGIFTGVAWIWFSFVQRTHTLATE